MASAPPTQQPLASRSHRARSLGVFVYLTQGARHSSYGQSTAEQLRKSVKLLYENYNTAQRDDVLFLHTGDVDDVMQKRVLELCGEEASFYQIEKRHFSLPPGVDPTSKEWLFPKKFSEGYRHMIRFFTVCIWEVVGSLGYQFVARLDDDAYILSPIRYNIFAFMVQRGLDYGFRLTSYESGEPAERGDFHTFVREYATKQSIKPYWGLAESCPDKSLDKFTLDRCGSVYTIYNNFFVSNVSFWRSPTVQRFLQHVDASKTIYYKRWGDALWHSIAVQLFLPRARVHMFDDFTYEHTSRKIYMYRNKPTVCFQWGGIALGTAHVGEAPTDVMMGRARSLGGINMCNRARGDVNRCFYTHRATGRLLGVFAGTVTPEPPDVLRDYCMRLRAEKEYAPDKFCPVHERWRALVAQNKSYVKLHLEDDPREYTCASRRQLFNTSLRVLFAGLPEKEGRTFSQLGRWVDGGLNSAVHRWSETPKEANASGVKRPKARPKAKQQLEPKAGSGSGGGGKAKKKAPRPKGSDAAGGGGGEQNKAMKAPRPKAKAGGGSVASAHENGAAADGRGGGVVLQAIDWALQQGVITVEQRKKIVREIARRIGSPSSK